MQNKGDHKSISIITTWLLRSLLSISGKPHKVHHTGNLREREGYRGNSSIHTQLHPNPKHPESSFTSTRINLGHFVVIAQGYFTFLYHKLLCQYMKTIYRHFLRIFLKQIPTHKENQ